MSTQLEITQWQKYEGDDWWKWAVWLEGPDEALDRVKFVEWTLHPTFSHPVRKSSDRSHKFRLDSAGWGVFPIRARVHTADGEFTLTHHLELHYDDGSKNTK